jgi:hypothetical protein
MVEPLRHRQTKGAATDMFYLMPPRHISTLPKAEVTSLESDVCITPESRHHRSSFILRIEPVPLAVDYLAALRDRHVDAGAALGIDQFDGLRHGVGIFPAVLHGFEVQAGSACGYRGFLET